MADIKTITLPDGTTYNIKDANALATLSISNNILTGTTRGGAQVKVTLPTDKDENVKVTESTSNATYPLMAVSASTVYSGSIYQAFYNKGITINPYKGNVNAAGGFFQTSDINKKNIIGELDLDKAYDLIDKCQTILYTLKDDDSDKEQIGLIAQEVKEFFPELITEDNDGSLSLDYSRLTVVILKVLKDIINRIKILESK